MATKKKTYVVTICRTAYAFHDVEVSASSDEEAREKALDIAGDYEYSEKDADYRITGLLTKLK